MILALPDRLLDVLPKNPYAFSDRSLITLDPTKIRKLTIRRGTRIRRVRAGQIGRTQRLADARAGPGASGRRLDHAGA